MEKLKFNPNNKKYYSEDFIKGFECGVERQFNADKEQTRWIPVSERLPEIQNYSDNYLVTLKRGGVHIAMFTECDGKHWWTYDDVEAWMPLPEPYKAESEDAESEDKE